MAPSLCGYQLLVIDETRGYRVDKTSSLCFFTISSIMMSSPVCLAILVPAISAATALNPIIMRDNTLVAIILTTVQLVRKTSAPTTVKPKFSDVQPQFHVTTAKVHFMERPVSRNISVSPTREKPWTQ